MLRSNVFFYFLFTKYVFFGLLIYCSNLFQDRQIEELSLLLSQFREMNEIITLVQGKFFRHVLPCFIRQLEVIPVILREIFQKIFIRQKWHWIIKVIANLHNRILLISSVFCQNQVTFCWQDLNKSLNEEWFVSKLDMAMRLKVYHTHSESW